MDGYPLLILAMLLAATVAIGSAHILQRRLVRPPSQTLALWAILVFSGVAILMLKAFGDVPLRLVDLVMLAVIGFFLVQLLRRRDATDARIKPVPNTVERPGAMPWGRGLLSLHPRRPGPDPGQGCFPPRPPHALKTRRLLLTSRPTFDRTGEPMVGRLLAIILVSLLACAEPASARQLRACYAPFGTVSSVAGVSVSDVADAEAGYRKLRVEARNGAHLFIYYDAPSETVARGRAACLGAQLNLLQDELGDTRRDAEWASVIFTQDKNYLPPRGAGVKPRWTVNVDAQGRLPPMSQTFLVSVIPHEQVHDFQYRMKAGTPRWFAEGHARWIQSKVVTRISSNTARADRAKGIADRNAAATDLDLINWDSVRPKREAIMRQVSEADRIKMQADPKYTPQGVFKFTTDDLIGDESNIQARYVAATNVFVYLEKKYGERAVRAWVNDVTGKPSRMSKTAMADAFKTRFGESLEDVLSKESRPVNKGK